MATGTKAARTLTREETETVVLPDRDAEALDAALAATIKKAESVASGYRASDESVGKLYRMMQLAWATEQLETLLDDAIMKRIMRLQGTKLGFITDKDREGGYPLATVKKCVIHGLLRGFYPLNNEMNIIAGNFYATKEGYERAVAELPGLTDLVLTPGVPSGGQGGALVPYIATWNSEGRRRRIERVVTKREDGSLFDGRIPVRVNAGMGADAILGKAKRKILAAIHAQETGSSHGDEDDEGMGAVIQATSAADALAKRLGVAEAGQVADAPPGEQVAPEREPGAEG